MLSLPRDDRAHAIKFERNEASLTRLIRSRINRDTFVRSRSLPLPGTFAKHIGGISLRARTSVTRLGTLFRRTVFRQFHRYVVIRASSARRSQANICDTYFFELPKILPRARDIGSAKRQSVSRILPNEPPPGCLSALYNVTLWARRRRSSPSINSHGKARAACWHPERWTPRRASLPLGRMIVAVSLSFFLCLSLSLSVCVYPPLHVDRTTLVISLAQSTVHANKSDAKGREKVETRSKATHQNQLLVAIRSDRIERARACERTRDQSRE